MIMRARLDLRALISQEESGSLEGGEEERVFLERECRGIGKNILLLSDAQKGYHAYDDAIKRFVLEKGLLDYLQSRRRQDFCEGRLTSLSDVLTELKGYHDSEICVTLGREERDIYTSILSDLDLFDPLHSQHPDNHSYIGHTLVTRQTQWAVTHLFREYSNFFSLPCTPSSPSIDSSSPSTRFILESYLWGLVGMLDDQIQSARRCRDGDMVRGRKIIPDYEDVHSSLAEDDVLIEMEKNIEKKRSDIQVLLSEISE